MSLILEALRKSEAERQRGQAPGLFVQQQALRRRRPGAGAWVRGGLALALAGVLAWSGWLWWTAGGGIGNDAPSGALPAGEGGLAPAVMPPGPPGDEPGAGGDAPAGVAGPTGSAGNAPGAWPPGTAVDAGPAAPSGQTITVAPAAVDPARTVADGPPRPGQARPPAELAPAATARAPDPRPMSPSAPGPAPASRPDPASAPGAPRGEAEAPPLATGNDAAPAPGASASGTGASASGTGASAPAAAGDAGTGPETAHLPRVADLSAAERGTLPPMKLSMHVYAADAAQRFVILDGRRLQEGGALAEGVFVQAITRDGLVLSVRGQPYWLGR